MTAAKKRPVSKLEKAVQTINKRERRALDLYLVGRWNHLDSGSLQAPARDRQRQQRTRGLG